MIVPCGDVMNTNHERVEERFLKEVLSSCSAEDVQEKLTDIVKNCSQSDDQQIVPKMLLPLLRGEFGVQNAAKIHWVLSECLSVISSRFSATPEIAVYLAVLGIHTELARGNGGERIITQATGIILTKLVDRSQSFQLATEGMLKNLSSKCHHLRPIDPESCLVIELASLLARLLQLGEDSREFLSRASASSPLCELGFPLSVNIWKSVLYTSSSNLEALMDMVGQLDGFVSNSSP